MSYPRADLNRPPLGLNKAVHPLSHGCPGTAFDIQCQYETRPARGSDIMYEGTLLCLVNKSSCSNTLSVLSAVLTSCLLTLVKHQLLGGRFFLIPGNLEKDGVLAVCRSIALQGHSLTVSLPCDDDIGQPHLLQSLLSPSSLSTFCSCQK
jgi:hypothetical protein